jgi:nucleoside-diphosphate-sugar epimerase
VSRRRVVVCTAADKRKVVVLGGTGRVGSATAVSLMEGFPGAYDVVVAGRSRENYEKAVKLRPGLAEARYQALDITDAAAIKVRRRGARRRRMPPRPPRMPAPPSA